MWGLWHWGCRVLRFPFIIRIPPLLWDTASFNNQLKERKNRATWFKCQAYDSCSGSTRIESWPGHWPSCFMLPWCYSVLPIKLLGSACNQVTTNFSQTFSNIITALKLEFGNLSQWSPAWRTSSHQGKLRHLRGYAKTTYGVIIYKLFNPIILLCKMPLNFKILLFNTLFWM
jgi:hypothetical protein